MSDITIKIDMNKLPEVKEISDIAVARALELCGAKWESDAKEITPVDTGRLRNSIKHKPKGNDTMVVETDVEYGVYVHEGARGRMGRPFLRLSGEQNVNSFKQIIENELKR